jgi:hypothetical protein
MAILTRTLTTLLILACAVPASAKDKPAPPSTPGSAFEAPTFSVDMTIQAQGQTFTMRRTVDHEKTRMDMKAEGMEVTQIQLGDEAGTSYLIMKDQKQVMKQTRKGLESMTEGHKLEELNTAGPEPILGKPEASQIESLGTDTIDGQPAIKYRVHYGEDSGLMWVGAGNNLPVRMEAQGSIVEFKNYDFSPPPRSAFEIPKGYQVMDMDEMIAKMKSSGMGGAGNLGMLMGGATGMGKGMAGSMAGSFAGGIGGGLGASLGGMVGGPIGSMVGQYVGQKIGQKIGNKVGSAAAGAVLPGK